MAPHDGGRPPKGGRQGRVLGGESTSTQRLWECADPASANRRSPLATPCQLQVPPGHALSIVSMNTMLESARAAGVPLKDAWRLTPQSLERLTRKGVSHVRRDVCWNCAGAESCSIAPRSAVQSTWHCARTAIVDGEPYYREIVADQMTMHPAVLVRIAEESAAYHPDNPVVDSVVQPSRELLLASMMLV